MKKLSSGAQVCCNTNPDTLVHGPAAEEPKLIGRPVKSCNWLLSDHMAAQQLQRARHPALATLLVLLRPLVWVLVAAPHKAHCKSRDACTDASMAASRHLTCTWRGCRRPRQACRCRDSVEDASSSKPSHPPQCRGHTLLSLHGEGRHDGTATAKARTASMQGRFAQTTCHLFSDAGCERQRRSSATPGKPP